MKLRPSVQEKYSHRKTTDLCCCE